MNDYMTPRLRAWRKWTDWPLLAIAIASLPLLLLELIRQQLAYGDRVFLDVVNIVVLLVFAVDYVVELALATQRANFVRREWTSLLIVFAQGIAFLPAVVSVPALRAFGSLRVLRAGRAWRAIAVVGRVMAIGGASAREGRALVRRRAASFALSFAGLTMLTSAVAFTLAEDVGERGRWHSFFDALWWSASTMTTVGSDIQPVTAVGRLIAIVTMLVGISTAAIVTAKVAEFLVRSGREDAEARR